MICVPAIRAAARHPTARQSSGRRLSRPLGLRAAVRHAVNSFFRFTHRAVESKALWSASERVWLGRATYLDWALNDPQIDIPWVVAETGDAPGAREDLIAAVRAELIEYWQVQCARLPRSRKPYWLPLP